MQESFKIHAHIVILSMNESENKVSYKVNYNVAFISSDKRLIYYRRKRDMLYIYLFFHGVERIDETI